MAAKDETIHPDDPACKPGPALSADAAKLFLMQTVETFGPARVRRWLDNLSAIGDVHGK